MRYALLMLLIFCGLLYAQPFMPALLGHENWLLNLTPLLLTYASLRAQDFSLMVFLIAGGLLHDLLLMNYMGMGPLLWGLVAFIVRSQKPWVETGNFLFLILITFVASFAYLCLDRLFFLISENFWSWNLKLSFELLKLSTVNALLSWPMFWLLDRLLRRGQASRRAYYAHAY
jgi:cell shape-determining protein MreD